MSFRPTDRLRDANDALTRLLQEPDIDDRILQAVNMFADALREKIPVISCGNGGSMCDAMHFAEELSGRYRKDRPPLPAMAVSDPSYLTCTANDYGYEESFSRWVQAFGRNGGVLLAISTSGNSGNVLRASLCAKELGMKIVALCGRDGGKLAGLADVCLIAPGETTDRIQELHIKLIHIMIEGIERLLFPENYC